MIKFGLFFAHLAIKTILQGLVTARIGVPSRNHRTPHMSLELLSQLETKIQATLENIELLKMELEEEKQKSAALTEKNQQLEQDLNSWSDKVNGLVGLLNSEI